MDRIGNALLHLLLAALLCLLFHWILSFGGGA